MKFKIEETEKTVEINTIDELYEFIEKCSGLVAICTRGKTPIIVTEVAYIE